MTGKLATDIVSKCNQAKELLGWEPKVSLREGLASMVEDFRKRLHLDDEDGDAEEKTNHSAK